MEFIGREEESSILEREYGERSSLVIIYGRRRVGKTALIDNFLRDKTNSMYFLATEESVVLNLERFSSSVSGFLGIPGARFSDWESALDAATKYGKTVIAIDEFQYLAQSDPAIPSIFQHAWDTILSKRDVMLILCGSFIGMMERYTLNYSSPLYGRRTASLKLGPLTFSDVCSYRRGSGIATWLSAMP
ncbi:ATP-binding protein [Methanomethylophilus alvi]|uniref:ATP-binding protein n=1 Tax=Methanomethylophilus alvi TaxID=1291540 RepID=UPI0037DCD434